MPKAERGRRLHNARHNPLHVDLEADKIVVPTKGRQPKRVKLGEEEGDGTQILPPKLSKKILEVAKEQQDEEEDVQLAADAVVSDGVERVDASGFVEVGDLVDEAEEKEFNQSGFVAAPSVETRTLADLILEKIREKEAKKMVEAVEGKGESAESELDPEVAAVYVEIGRYLSKFKSGRIPKAFKIIPRLSNWEEILYLTDPVKWTANAMYQATRIFASNMNPAMAQRFYSLVLLPAVREDIKMNQRLNFHYYEALKKAIFKPRAWLKGIFLNLANDGCTYREAIIVGSVAAKVSIPALEVGAALMKLFQSQKGASWTGSVSILIAALLGKKSSLPHSAVLEGVRYFHSFAADPTPLPVVWHRSLLMFVQRYKCEITSRGDGSQPFAMLEAMKELLREHCHPQIGEEIKRELFRTPEAVASRLGL